MNQTLRALISALAPRRAASTDGNAPSGLSKSSLVQYQPFGTLPILTTYVLPLINTSCVSMSVMFISVSNLLKAQV